jgi:acetyl esterase/lipase
MRHPDLRLLRTFLFFLLAPWIASAAEPTVIPLWPQGVPGLRADASPEKLENARASNVHQPSLTVYPAPAEKATGAAVIICPGGGYVRLSMENEGAQVAAWLNSIGVTAFVLKYRMVEYGHPAPLRDVLRAVRLVRSQAADFALQPDRLGVIGFSAGGHLAASAGTLFDSPEGQTGAALDAVSARPDFLLLMYPVITLHDPYAHAGSRRALLGENATAAQVAAMSLESRVTAATPPTFLVHTQEDTSVPIENSLLFYRALRAAGVPTEVHLFEKGPHGFGMRKEFGQTSAWIDRAEVWMRGRGLLTRKGQD